MASVRRPKSRIVIPIGAYPEFHEITTAQVLVRRGVKDDEVVALKSEFAIMGAQAATAGLDWPAQRRFFDYLRRSS